MSQSVFRLGPEETRKPMAALGGPMRCLVSKADSGGRLTVVEQRLDAPGGTPLHLHFDGDEWMTVLEGGPLTVQVGQERTTLSAGESLFIPRGTPHTFNNLSGRPLRMMAVCTPGGIEHELDEQARYILGLPPGQHPDPERVAAIWKENGAVVGPPIFG